MQLTPFFKIHLPLTGFFSIRLFLSFRKMFFESRFSSQHFPYRRLLSLLPFFS